MSKTKVSAGLVSPEVSLLSLQRPPFLCILTWSSSLGACSWWFFVPRSPLLIRVPARLGSIPPNVNLIACVRPQSPNSHILRYWGSGLQREFWGARFSPCHHFPYSFSVESLRAGCALSRMPQLSSGRQPQPVFSPSPPGLVELMVLGCHQPLGCPHTPMLSTQSVSCWAPV